MSPERAQFLRRAALGAPANETVAAIEADIPNIAATYTKQHNIKRADELVAAMRPLVTKWVKLVEPVDNADALADLYWNEVYSKVDVKVHGMR